MPGMRALPVLLLVLALGGCGSSGLRRAALARRADAICAKYAKKAKALGAPDLAAAGKAASYFTRAHDLAQQQQTELAGLEPATAAKPDYDAMTKATGDVTRLFGDLAAAAKAKDRKRGAKLLTTLTPLVAQVSDTAKTVGAKNCGGA
jgi:hypothetical protein